MQRSDYCGLQTGVNVKMIIVD